MSLEDLRADLEMNLEQTAKLSGPLVTAPEVADHLNKVLWPFLKNVVTEMDEMDGSIEDLYRNAEDILQPETASRIAAVIVTANGLITRELGKRLDPNNVKDKAVLAAITEWVKLSKEVGDEIEQITVQVAEGVEPDDEEDDDEEDEDEEDDDDDYEDDDDDGDDDDDDDEGDK